MTNKTIAIGWVAARLANITPGTTVYEPTAGHGALLLEASPRKVLCNELNPLRAKVLRQRGYRVTTEDAVSYRPAQRLDVVILNPPFGSIPDDQGFSKRWAVKGGDATATYSTTQIDHAICLNSLFAMKDDGRAVILLGAPLSNKTGNSKRSAQTYNSQQNRAFYKSLYDNYNVIDHICLGGSLYRKQGTTFPVDLIVIAGRGQSARKLPAAYLPRVYQQFSQLREYLSHELSQRALSLDTANSVKLGPTPGQRSRLERQTHFWDGSVSTSVGTESRVAHLPRTDLGSGLRLNLQLSGLRPDANPSQTRTDGITPAMGLGGDAVQRTAAGLSADVEPSRPITRATLSPLSTSTQSHDGGSPRSHDRNDARRMAQRHECPLSRGVMMNGHSEPTQVSYRPKSQAQSFDTLVPTNMQTAVAEALTNLEQRVGNVDRFVADQLQLGEVDELYERFGAEQIDALGLAFHNLAQQQSFIIGDQTGVGKGRFVAAIIEQTRQRGLIPVFVTQDDKLYADMFRDLNDIGVDDLNPLLTNNGLRIPLPGGDLLRTPAAATHKAVIEEIAIAGNLGEYDVIFTTYSQLQTVRGQETHRRELLRQLAPQAVLILDESHNAGGTKKNYKTAFAVPDRADFVRELVEASAGVVYSSATYAKNPYTMTLYAAKTGMREVAMGEELVEMVQSGGVPLQQMLASKLAEAGQYVRRERSYEGIEFEAQIAAVDHDIAGNIAKAMSLVMAFDAAKAEGVAELDEALRAEAKQRGMDNAIGSAGATSTNFTSVMHNLIGQSLLAMKAEATVQAAIAALEKNEKPVIALSNTMGSLIETTAQEQDLSAGDPILLSTADMLRRYLERSREVLIKDYTSVGARHYLSDRELGHAGVAAYKRAVRFIEGGDWGENPISPIDYIRFRLEQAGYRTGEITGRRHRVEYASDGELRYQIRSSHEVASAGKIEAVNGFNAGEINALIINRSGSTGISLHASERFGDQRPRRMIIAQPDLNIDVFMQTLGRIHRTGQVVKPAFTLLMGDIPAEKRPAAVLLKKMASLNANTTAARESGFHLGQVTDFMNAYGDQVAVELMAARPDIHERLGRPMKYLSDDSDFEKIDFSGAVAKITGRIPLLSLQQQEQVYQLIEQEYLELVAREEAMGQSILKAETLDLDAKPLARMEVMPGEADGNPFAEPTHLEVMDVKALRKPMTTLEVVNAVRGAVELEAISNLDGHQPQEVREMALQRNEQDMAEALSFLPSYKATFEANIRTQAQVRKLPAEQRETLIQSRLAVLEKKLDSQTNHIQTTLEQFPTGQTVRLQSEQDGAVYYGVVEQVIRKVAEGANPVNPAAWKLQIQVADAMGKLRMPLSKINTASPTGIILRAQATASFSHKEIYSLFDQCQSLAREQRQIFTGNVIRAFSSHKGKLINFTDHRGQVRQGLLMAKEFDITENLEQQPVLMPDPLKAFDFLQQNGQEGPTRLKSNDENLTVHFNRKILFLNTPKVKALGGRYYLDEDLLEAAQAEFVSTGRTMKLRVEGEQIPAVLSYLYDNGKPLYAFDQRGLARQMLGLETPQLVEVDEVIAEPQPVAQVSRADTGLGRSSPQEATANTQDKARQPIPQKLSIEHQLEFEQPGLNVDAEAMEVVAPEAIAVPENPAEAPPETAGYSPCLQELRDWLQDARINGRSPRYIERIKALSVEFLADSPLERLSPSQRDPAFRNPTFSLSEAGWRAMLRDRELSEQVRSPQRHQLLAWYSAAKQLGQSAAQLKHIQDLGRQQIAGTREAEKPTGDRNPNFNNPNFTLSRIDHIFFQKTLDQAIKVNLITPRSRVQQKVA